MDIRKYLKVVGVTSQREIELAVRAALAKGTLVETSVLKPTMILCIPEIGLNHVIDGESRWCEPANGREFRIGSMRRHVKTG